MVIRRAYIQQGHEETMIILPHLLYSHYSLSFFLIQSRPRVQGCALSEPSGPWRLTFSLGN